MNRQEGLSLGLLAAGCAIVLAVSATPGLLSPFAWLPQLVVIAGMVVGVPAMCCLLLAVYLQEKPLLSRFVSRFRWGFYSLGFLMIMTASLMVFLEIPQWLGFALSRRAFESARQHPDAVAPFSLVDWWIGPYHVDRCGTDPRGGTYFRLHAHDFVIETYSYGFCYQPNPKGTPFGDGLYETWPLGDGWAVFTANDD